MNLDDLVLDPIYDTLGVDVTIEDGTDVVFEGRVLDKTAGLELDAVPGRENVGMNTVYPLMAVKAKDLAAQGLNPEDLLSLEVDLNGVTWVIQNHIPKPGIAGEPGGQVYFQMRKRLNG